MQRRDVLMIFAASLSPLCRAGRAGAQTLSRQPIRLVVPFPPGGATDIVARPLAHILGDIAGITVVVVNHGGAGGSLGAEDVAHATADGRTLLMGTVGTQAINASLYKHLPYRPIEDFTPVALVAMAPVAIVVHPSLAVNNVADLVALAKRMPGKLNYGTGGAGTPGHLTAEMFKAAAAIDIQHVPYKGGGPAITDLLAGNIAMMFEPLQSLLPHIKAGKIRAIAVSRSMRLPAIPNVPTIAESGYPSFEASAWWGVFGPANLTPATVDTLGGDIKQAVASAAFRKVLEPLGVIPMFRDKTALAAFEKSELLKWGKAQARLARPLRAASRPPQGEERRVKCSFHQRLCYGSVITQGARRADPEAELQSAVQRHPRQPCRAARQGSGQEPCVLCRSDRLHRQRRG